MSPAENSQKDKKYINPKSGQIKDYLVIYRIWET